MTGRDWWLFGGVLFVCVIAVTRLFYELRRLDRLAREERAKYEADQQRTAELQRELAEARQHQGLPPLPERFRRVEARGETFILDSRPQRRKEPD